MINKEGDSGKEPSPYFLHVGGVVNGSFDPPSFPGQDVESDAVLVEAVNGRLVEGLRY